MSTNTTSQKPLPEFLQGSKAKGLLIGGKWQPSLSGEEVESINPANGQVISRISIGNADDIDLAVAAARRAFEGEWSTWKPKDRQRLFFRIQDIIAKNFDELAMIETMDMGAPLARTLPLADFCMQLIGFFGSQCHAATGETMPNSLPGKYTTLKIKAPVGVVGGIFAWNGPLMSQWWILGPALATGCTVVLKPSEEACLTVLRVAELLQEAGVPDGVINVVPGRGPVAGQALAAHPGVDRISFTGSTETGRKIIQASASNIKRVQLELGGKSPDMVFADADLDKAAIGAAAGAFMNSGQSCTAGTRIFVQRSIQDEFADKVCKYAGSLKVGDGLDPSVNLGPLTSQRQLDRVLNYIDIGRKEGATITAGGERIGGDLATGFFVQPTVFLGVTNEMTIAREEIFGPVVSLIPFDDIDDGLRMANDTPYGLAGGVWTKSLSTAHRVAEGIKAGTIWVNSYNVLDPNVGFGGYKMSGYGWKGGRSQVEGFLYEKVVYLNLD